jgi:hypothetical protein
MFVNMQMRLEIAGKMHEYMEKLNLCNVSQGL